VDEDLNILEGEREAEDMIVEAYTAVLLAFLSLERYLYTSSKEKLYLVSLVLHVFCFSFLSVDYITFFLLKSVVR
jgi:hypothetical protein